MTKDRVTYLKIFIFYLLFVPILNFGLYSNVSSKISKAWRKIERGLKGKHHNSIKYSRKLQTQAFATFRDVSDIIEDFSYMTEVVDAIEETEYFDSKVLPLMEKMEAIRQYKLGIKLCYETVQNYYENLDTLQTSTLLHFAKSNVAPDPLAMRQYVQRIFYELFGVEEDEDKAAKVFEQLANNFEKSNDVSCRRQQSAQQYLYSFYNDIAVTELTGITLLEFSWMILRVHERGNFTADSNLARREYQERMKRTVRILRKALEGADRKVWRCDPPKHIYGVTYAVIIDDPENGPRIFSLHESVADTKNNMVVTGLRFQNIEDIFYLQIQQGQLLPRGSINSSTLEWRPLELLNVNTAIEGVDYHLVRSSAKKVDLDEIVSELQNFVMTGVRLKSSFNSLGLTLALNEFNFERGELISPEEGPMWQTKYVVNRKRLWPFGNTISTSSLKKSYPSSTSEVYIEFKHTKSSHNKKFRESIPFIDLQDVVSNAPVPLEGAGILYKSVRGYGGFLAPKIITINLNNYPLPDLPKKNFKEMNIE